MKLNVFSPCFKINKLISYFSFQPEAFCPSHISPFFCLTGAFSALLEFRNSHNTAPGWLAECLWFMLEGLHFEHMRDRTKVREKGAEEIKKIKKEVDQVKQNEKASWFLAEQRGDIHRSVFPFHSWRPGLYLPPLWAGTSCRGKESRQCYVERLGNGNHQIERKT